MCVRVVVVCCVNVCVRYVCVCLCVCCCVFTEVLLMRVSRALCVFVLLSCVCVR